MYMQMRSFLYPPGAQDLFSAYGGVCGGRSRSLCICAYQKMSGWGLLEAARKRLDRCNVILVALIADNSVLRSMRWYRLYLTGTYHPFTYILDYR